MNRTIKLTLKVYLLALSIFTVFRLALFIVEFDRVDIEATSWTTVFGAFFMGVRFDLVIIGYITLFPTFALLLIEGLRKNSRIAHKIVFYIYFVLFSIGFIVCAADIPYFGQFYDRFTIGAFEWFDNIGFVVGMIVEEPKYFLAIVPLVVLEVVLFKFLKKIFAEKNLPDTRMNIPMNVVASLLFLGVMFLGVRGRIEKKSPIRVGTAYFSDNAFLNKMGLNPVFTLMRSYLDSKDKRNQLVHLISKEDAYKNVKEYFGVKNAAYKSPIARDVTHDTTIAEQPNIVVVIMESMSAKKMARHGNEKGLTPFLDSLSNQALYFENTYTAGKHTFNGIFSTLFSYPALYRQHTMKKIRNYDGISGTLQKAGYSTTYFTTHDSQFDNVEGFMRANQFDEVISEKNYPSEEVKTTLGVPDDYMFRHSIPVMNELSKKDKPFFVSFMTCSDHGPYYIPDYFTPKNEGVRDQIVEYADWSLGRLINLASKESWFDNTIFVFVADHGAPLGSTYEIALSYFHTPLVFYSPKYFPAPKTYNQIASQLDIYPTLMGMIKQPYVNNTLGVDLMSEKRDFVIINDDDKIGILDTTHFCIMKTEKDKPQLYLYKEGSKTNLYDSNKEKADAMIKFAKSNMQTHQEMILSKETSINSK